MKSPFGFLCFIGAAVLLWLGFCYIYQHNPTRFGPSVAKDRPPLTREQAHAQASATAGSELSDSSVSPNIPQNLYPKGVATEKVWQIVAELTQANITLRDTVRHQNETQKQATATIDRLMQATDDWQDEKKKLIDENRDLHFQVNQLRSRLEGKLYQIPIPKS